MKESTRGVTVKLPVLVMTPPGVVTVMRPEMALVATSTVICVAVRLVMGALTVVEFTAAKVTEVTPVKFVPVSVTVVPTTLVVGVNVVRRGGR